jgi:hypothetical protein
MKGELRKRHSLSAHQPAERIKPDQKDFSKARGKLKLVSV